MRLNCAWSQAAANAVRQRRPPAAAQREIEPSHERVAVGARAVPGPELASEFVAAQARDRFELARAHDGALTIQDRAGSVERRVVETTGRTGRLAVGVSCDQAFRQPEHDSIECQRLGGRPERGGDRAHQRRVLRQRARARMAWVRASPDRADAAAMRAGSSRRSGSRTRPRPRRARRALRRGGARRPGPARYARPARGSRTSGPRPR